MLRPPDDRDRRAEAFARPTAPRTLPEQVADQIAIAIVRGRYVEDGRIREQELAEEFGVSRGPVREAIRLLERRGLVVVEPRRGARATRLSVDVIADSFNLRGCLLGLAARCFAGLAQPEAQARLAARIDDIASAAEDPAADPTGFARMVGRAGAVIARDCGAEQLTRILREQARYSLWGLLWSERVLDFQTAARRAEARDEWRDLAADTSAGRAYEAELKARDILFRSRDAALAVLFAETGERPDPARAFADRFEAWR